MPNLFEPYSLKDITFRNRIGVSPMCQYWCNDRDGKLTDWHLVHLGSRAVGGAGLVMCEATAVEARGRITPQDAGLWEDAQIKPLARIAHFVKQYGAVPGMQLAHAGRKASCARPWEGDHSLRDDEGGWETIAPSPIAFGGSGNRLWRVPREMIKQDIVTVRQAFVAAARRADEAGFDLLELHAAHGYLAHSFYSPLANQRTDAYGGSFANRIRFTLETVRALRAVWPERKVLAIRLSCTDWVEGGWTLGDSVELARLLKAEGVDLVDCSSGFGAASGRYPIGPGWQVSLADTIRREAGIATAAVGAITEPRQADAIVREGQADLVLLGTQFLRDPYWPLHAAAALGQGKAHALPSPYDYMVGGLSYKN